MLTVNSHTNAVRYLSVIANALLHGNSHYTEQFFCTCILNAAARAVSDSRKFDSAISSVIHHKLHLLDVPERVAYEQSVMVRRSLHTTAAPGCLSELCTLVVNVASRRHLAMCLPK